MRTLKETMSFAARLVIVMGTLVWAEAPARAANQKPKITIDRAECIGNKVYVEGKATDEESNLTRVRIRYSTCARVSDNAGGFVWRQGLLTMMDEQFSGKKEEPFDRQGQTGMRHPKVIVDAWDSNDPVNDEPRATYRTTLTCATCDQCVDCEETPALSLLGLGVLGALCGTGIAVKFGRQRAVAP